MKRPALELWLLMLLLLAVWLVLAHPWHPAGFRQPDEVRDFSALKTEPKPTPGLGRLCFIPGSDDFYVAGPALPLSRVRLDGTVLWQSQVNQYFQPQLYPTSSGSIFMERIDWQHSLRRLGVLDAQGAEAWSQLLVFPSLSDDYQYLPCKDALALAWSDKLWLLDARGQTRWAVDQLSDIRLLEKCGPGGEILGTCSNKGLVCFSPAGKLLWSTGQAQHSVSGIHVDSLTDWVVVATAQGVEAYDLQGLRLWGRSIPSYSTNGQQAWLLGDCALVKEDWDRWCCYERSGARRFSLSTEGDESIKVVRGSDHNIYIKYLTARYLGASTLSLTVQGLLELISHSSPTADCRLLCLSPQGRQLWQARFGYVPGGPILLPDGNIALTRRLQMFVYHPQP